MLTVAWSAPGNDGGADVTGYDLRYIRSDAPDKADANWTVRNSVWSSGALRYTLGGLTNGVEYDIQVRAVNAAGRGEWSNSITGTPQTIPAAPTIDSVVSGDGALTVAWTAPSDTGGSGIQSYDLRYIRSDAPSKADANWTVEDSVWTSGNREYTLSGLNNGVRYDLQLRAVTSTGDGPWSASAASTPQTAPQAPSISSLTPGGSALTAAWDAPSNTGGSDITAYDLRYIRSTPRTRPTPIGRCVTASGVPAPCSTPLADSPTARSTTYRCGPSTPLATAHGPIPAARLRGPHRARLPPAR